MSSDDFESSISTLGMDLAEEAERRGSHSSHSSLKLPFIAVRLTPGNIDEEELQKMRQEPFPLVRQFSLKQVFQRESPLSELEKMLLQKHQVVRQVKLRTISRSSCFSMTDNEEDTRWVPSSPPKSDSAPRRVIRALSDSSDSSELRLSPFKDGPKRIVRRRRSHSKGRCRDAAPRRAMRKKSLDRTSAPSPPLLTQKLLATPVHERAYSSDQILRKIKSSSNHRRSVYSK